MLQTIAVLVTSLAPLGVVAFLLALAAWRDRRRGAAVARQIRVTDAIARELGAIVAPVVSRPLRGPWRVHIAVPLARPATVSRLLAIVHGILGPEAPGRYEIVLSPQPTPERSVPAWPAPARPVAELSRQVA